MSLVANVCVYFGSFKLTITNHGEDKIEDQ